LCIVFFALSMQAASVAVNCGSQLGDPVAYAATEFSASCTGLSTEGRGGSTASGHVNLQLAADPGNYSTLELYQSGYARETWPLPGNVNGRGTLATVTISYSQSLTTAGPVRPGYLQI